MEDNMQAGDLHTDRASHISVPIKSDDTEIHLNKNDYINKLDGPPKVGEKYLLCQPVDCTSVEGNMVRVKLMDEKAILAEPEEYGEEESSEDNSFSSMPREELKKKLPKAGY